MKLHRNVGVYFDIWPFTEDCREYGCPPQINVNFFRWHVLIQLPLPYRGVDLRHLEPSGRGVNAAGNEVLIFADPPISWLWNRLAVRAWRRTSSLPSER